MTFTAEGLIFRSLTTYIYIYVVPQR